MAHQQGRDARPAPIFVTQQRKLRDFLDDQDRLATIKSDWLYRMADTRTRARILSEHGFTPVMGREIPSAAQYATA